MKKRGRYLLVLCAQGRRVVVVRGSLHRHIWLHGGGSHIGGVRHRRDESGASVRLRRIRIRHVSRLRSESRRHASTTLSGTVAELVVRWISHLLVVVGVETATSTTTLRLEVASTGASIITLSRVSRLTTEVRAGL